MPEPISPPPVTDYRPEFLPAYIANGVLGLRCGRIPFRTGTTIVNGFAGIDPADGVEGFNRAPYALAGDVELDGVRLANAPQLVRFVEQRYDFATAELTTTLQFAVGDSRATIEVVAFCSHTLPTVVCQELSVTVDRPADLAIAVGIDPAAVPGTAEYVGRSSGRETSTDPDSVVIWHGAGNLSRCGIAFVSEFPGGGDHARTVSPHDENGMTSTTYRFRARRGRRYRVRQMTSLVPDLVHPHPADQATRLLATAQVTGWEGVREANRAAWKDLWRSRIEIDGASTRWQAITDASLFYLLTSVHPSSVAGTSLFGLAYWPNYHYYRGHVMWDIETFVVPPLTLLDPWSARSILDYRVRHLEDARQNAKINGWRGAMYPWESCPLHGEEVTPGASAPTKGHVSMDVALAIGRYIDATGNTDHLRRWAWPLIEAAAEYVESRVERSARGFEIRRMTGPAETNPAVDNNAFVNMASAVVLRDAVRFAGQLGEEARPSWSEIADALVVPRAARGHLVNHDGYRLDELKGGTPEAAAGLFPVGYEVDAATARATYRFAAEQQAPAYVGTPMLSGFLGLYAARAGRPELAMELLERGYADFINEPFLETDEFSRTAPGLPRSGPMFANIGAYLTSLMLGFPGLRIGAGEPTTWAAEPVTMPAGWRAIRMERIWARGETWSLTARTGASRAELTGPRRRETAA